MNDEHEGDFFEGLKVALYAEGLVAAAIFAAIYVNLEAVLSTIEQVLQ